MRKSLVLALSAFLVLVALGSSAFAQTPAPKVTITGLFDQVTLAGRNFYDGNFARDGDQSRPLPEATGRVGRAWLLGLTPRDPRRDSGMTLQTLRGTDSVEWRYAR